MSERGSFTTQYIYCPKCREAVVSTMEKFCHEEAISWHGAIICGFAKGLYSGEEFNDVKGWAEELSGRLCHEVRIVVLPDDDEYDALITIRNGQVFATFLHTGETERVFPRRKYWPPTNYAPVLPSKPLTKKQAAIMRARF